VQPLVVPRVASFSSQQSSPAPSPSKVRRVLGGSDRLPSDLDLGKVMARNSSSASLLGQSPSSHTAAATARPPPRPPSSVLNQFFLDDDE
jgi:hypothetical protein